MSSSYTQSTTFTITHARHIASRIAADLRVLNRYYGSPALGAIDNYLEEAAQLLAKGYMKTLEIGFKRDDARVISLHYEVRTDGTLGDNRSGGVRAGVDISGAVYFNYLTYASKWWDLSESGRTEFKAALPIQRTTANEPTDGAGYWIIDDRSYAAGGTGVQRKSFVPW